MLKPELLNGLTPESLKGLEPAEKQRLIEILKDLQLTGFQRYMRDLWARVEAVRRDYQNRGVDMFEDRRAKGLPSLHDVLENARKNPDHTKSLAFEVYHAPDHQAYMAEQERLEAERQQQITEQFRKAQEHYQQREAQFAESLPVSNMPKFVSIAEMARQAQEQAFAEANKEPADFIERICGPGSDKPSGAPRKGWMD
jgi:hypothetical protein